jgi:DNA uptake protein ComE-like DNA-binding protein
MTPKEYKDLQERLKHVSLEEARLQERLANLHEQLDEVCEQPNIPIKAAKALAKRIQQDVAKHDKKLSTMVKAVEEEFDGRF